VLTHPAPGVQDIDPKVSPDGTRILFERDLPDTSEIGIVGADGRGEHLLDLPCTDPCVGVQTPTWAPDGEHVVFTRVMGPFGEVNGSAASAVLWKSNLDGSHLMRLSQPGIDGVFEDYNATFAPDGYIVFLRIRNADVKSAAFRMNPDGSDVRRLTPWSVDADELSVSPARSGPSESLVVFETYGHGAPDGVVQAIATVSADSRCQDGCGHITYLTSPKAESFPSAHFNPTWSPDGKEIAYVKFSYVETDTAPVHGDIWRMRWDGEGKAGISHSPLFEFRPAWGW
jgi:Tol biopolymer transport system component